jgi:hypothetical protein
MWWRKRKPLRQELINARLNIERQLEILRGAPQIKVTPSPDNRSLIETLEEELREIDEAIANLGTGDA